MKKFIIILFLLIPFLTLAQENPAKKKAYYFFGEQCPHCKTVDEYFQANGIYEKYEITKLEVVSNPFNGKLFLEFGKAFDVPDWGGVPAIVFGDKYLLGDKPIMDNFVKEINAADNANELPDPDKIAAANNTGEQGSSSVPSSGTSTSKGNKNNYFLVVIGALVVLGAGALIYINRKKQ
jgi:LPXTG-motif cell wall-anchored protein